MDVKSRKYSQGYNSKYVNGNIKVLNCHHIELPKLGTIYFRAGRLPMDKIKSTTICLNAVGQYYIAVLVGSENQTLPKISKYTGGDLGLKSLFNLPDRYKKPINHFGDKYRRKLYRWEELHSHQFLRVRRGVVWNHRNKVLVPRQLDDFKSYQKAYITVAKYRQRAANQRLDQLQEFTTKLAKKCDIIVSEKLNIKGMMRDRHLARAITNASRSELADILQYKCNWHGEKPVQVNPSYTNQIYANCGEGNRQSGLGESEWLAVHEWDCPNYGEHLDRNVNTV